MTTETLSPNADSPWNHGMTDQPAGSPELLLYQTENGRPRIQCRFEDGAVGPPDIIGDAG